MKRQKIAAGNWKMNLEFEEALQLARSLSHVSIPEDVLVILGVPYVYLKDILDMVLHTSRLEVAAQNCHDKSSGAYTGEISAPMLRSLSIPYVILGHSERRAYFGESDALLASKTNIVLENGMIPIFCCGESLEVRKVGDHVTFVKEQIRSGLFHLSDDDFNKVIIAYEPIWAIGTGETASPEQAQEMHKSIRMAIAENYGENLAEGTSILYGGSVKPANASELFAQADVDGGLVGGASLDAEGFGQIIQSFS